MQGDNSKAGRLGREATVRPTRVDFFFLSQNWVFDHHIAGPFSQKTLGAQTTNKDGERHTSHENRQILFPRLCVQGRLHQHAHT